MIKTRQLIIRCVAFRFWMFFFEYITMETNSLTQRSLTFRFWMFFFEYTTMVAKSPCQGSLTFRFWMFFFEYITLDAKSPSQGSYSPVRDIRFCLPIALNIFYQECYFIMKNWLKKKWRLLKCNKLWVVVCLRQRPINFTGLFFGWPPLKPSWRETDKIN